MSIEIMQEVWKHAPVDQGSLLILLALADSADEKSRTCYPGMDSLAKKSRLSRRQVITCIQNLEKLGIIEVRRYGSPIKTNLYKIRRPELWLLEACAKTSHGRCEAHFTSDVKPTSPEPSVTEEGAPLDPLFEDEPSLASPSQPDPEVSTKRNGWMQ